MDFFENLLTQTPGKQVSPELLSQLGNQASEMFRTQGVPLNDAIKQLASQHPELGNEHIKRIVEFANTVTFQQMFEANQDKNVDFNIADPGVILRDLRDGSAPAFDGKPLDGSGAEYKMSPQNVLGSAGNADQELNSMFANGSNAPANGAGDFGMKLASLNTDHTTHANPVEDVYDEQVRLQGARDQIAASHEQFDQMRKQAREELYQAVKTEVVDADGAGLGGVIKALEKIAGDEMTAAVMEPFIVRMMEEGVQDLPRSLEKRAGAYLNPQHPIALSWGGMVHAAEEQVKCAEALDQIDDALAKCAAFISKSAGAVTSAVRKATGAAHGKVLPALRQRFPKAQ